MSAGKLPSLKDMDRMTEDEMRKQKVTLNLSEFRRFGRECATEACDIYGAEIEKKIKEGWQPNWDEISKKIDELNKIGERLENVEKEIVKATTTADGARTEAFNMRKQNEKLAGAVFEVKDKLTEFVDKAAKAEPKKDESHECISCGTKSDEKIEKGVGVCSGDGKNGNACQEPRPKFDSHERVAFLFCPRCGSNILDVTSKKTWFDLYAEAEKAKTAKK